MTGAWNKVLKLFGISNQDETDSHSIKHQTAWLERRRRFLNRRCGRLVDGKDIDSCNDPQASRKKRFKRQASVDQQAPRRQRSRRDFELHPNANRTLDASRNEEFGEINSPLKETIDIPNYNNRVLLRTSSDTAIDSTTVKPQFQLNKNHGDGMSLSSYDFTDFNAKESITKILNDVLARNQPRRALGMGLVGNLLSRKFRKDLTFAQLNAIHSFDDHRPYFTYWVTTVQILIMIITLTTYGFGPFGFSKTIVKGSVYVSSLSWHTESYQETDNIWFGPRVSDLIHLGAKFTPCMRKDFMVYESIYNDREQERYTGCCIRNDQSGCLQTTKEACSTDAKWHSWNETNQLSTPSGSKRRRSGPVCGQDPQYCQRPASTPPHEWPDDITQWPICQEQFHTIKQSHHMSCKLTGRPCCVGIYGQCLITHSEHCQFLRGTFHPEATLCSQVSCMEDVCGMVPFYARDYPDQFYRLFTALFLHAGLIHLLFTVILQYYIMRDIERLLGPARMAIIYTLPGIAGYLASATFVPYHTQVGPSGSQFALLACLVAETINNWKLIEDPFDSIWKLISIAIGLFILGLLPWIDNYAHIFGFFVGLALSLALTPYLTPFNDTYSRRKKVIQIWVCILIVISTFVLLPLPLYIFPLYKCSWCRYLDCWPLAPNWCENQDIKFTRSDIF